MQKTSLVSSFAAPYQVGVAEDKVMSDTVVETPGTQAFFSRSVVDSDRDVALAIHDEIQRQQNQIELIASENIVSRAVLEAQGSPLTNKYA